jgi:hypothetical protein
MITFALWHSVQAERIRGGLPKLGLAAIIPYAIGFIPTCKKKNSLPDLLCNTTDRCADDLCMHHEQRAKRTHMHTDAHK